MNRSGLCEAKFDCREDILAYGRFRGAVKKTVNGKKGQAFLKELLTALEAMPEKKLVKERLMDYTGEVCAIGCILQSRGIGTGFDSHDYEKIAGVLGINEKLVQEIEWNNDHNTSLRRIFMVSNDGIASKMYYNDNDDPVQRYEDMVKWVKDHIND